MDRTKEFFSIVDHNEIQQNPFENKPFFLNIAQIEQEINKTFNLLSKITQYESFKAQPLIKKVTELLKEYKNVPIPDRGASRDHEEVLLNLKAMVNTKFLRYTLRLNEIKRNIQKEVVETPTTTANTNKSTMKSNENTSLLLQEEQINQQKNEFLSERKRIVKSINEIGQIVEDISIHVRLQEEQLKRVDDIVTQTDKWSKKAFGELNDIWYMVRSNRKKIIKFFVFWIFVILIFWLIGKM